MGLEEMPMRGRVGGEARSGGKERREIKSGKEAGGAARGRGVGSG